MIRTHDTKCRCAPCRHERFNPGPPSLARRGGGWYGHFKVGMKTRRHCGRVKTNQRIVHVSKPVGLTEQSSPLISLSALSAFLFGGGRSRVFGKSRKGDK